ncbi:MAG: hypothetical protein A2951_00270 [Candidatus Buchananbacteria bacterium RIFCSPLOWO2_01_FULL_56_15]|uniref:PEP-utilising enzyme mobile domain-containing protein n=2 Tax=Candidatus Buchananiibacteriota TaxID=1817903 RepID=A0A1G1YEX2_9BACT|nr:MAG: hypothetical protein A3J59_01200 [Candidatus Buchananbacteria bacterium RIFCSPHIGHO2_02_FULL_56_16]OGY55438.1 MAG: hypothetical protein A2951_00270 [Candidatus Buchananbacteria bacterium RIFCSPLOWO2_01_FULL_56_15]
MNTKKLKYLNDKDPWMLAEEIPDIDFFFCQIWLKVFVNEFEKPSGRAYRKVLAVLRGYHLWFYYGEKDSRAVGDFLVSRFLRTPEFTKTINKQIVALADKLSAFAHKVPQENLSQLTNQRLWRLYKAYNELHTEFYRWGWLPVGVDMFHSNLTDRLKQYLRSIDVPEYKVNEYLVLLTQPTKKSLIQIEQDEFVAIAIKIKKDVFHRQLFSRRATAKTIKRRIKPHIRRLIENHWQKYHYVKFLWIGKEGVYTIDYYIDELIKLVNSAVDLSKQYQRRQRELKHVLEQRIKLIARLHIKNPWRTIIDAWGDFMLTKIYRRFAQIYAIYQMQPVIQEIARRLDITLMQARFLLKDEVKEALLNNKINRAILNRRTKFCLYYTEKNRSVILTGEKARKIAKSVQLRVVVATNELRGQTGCIGKATGTVKIVIRPADMAKFNKGDILISIATDPDIVPAMKKAAAIVTEQGGITSHAAIVSRELGVPCVIGTKIATKVFKDGDRVEVDATNGVVRKV